MRIVDLTKIHTMNIQHETPMGVFMHRILHRFARMHQPLKSLNLMLLIKFDFGFSQSVMPNPNENMRSSSSRSRKLEYLQFQSHQPRSTSNHIHAFHQSFARNIFHVNRNLLFNRYK